MFHLRLYRRLGGEVFTALMNDEVVGNIELLPHEDCLLGPRAYINVLWVKEGRRRAGVGRMLVREAIEWARLKGYRYLDTIPERDSIGFYTRLGFKPKASQIKAIKEIRGSRTHEIPNSDVRKIDVADEPSPGMVSVTGTYRPGLFTWHSAWEEICIPPRKKPEAYKLMLNGEKLIIMLHYYSGNSASLILWTEKEPNDHLLKNTISISEHLASEAGITKVFV